MTPQTSRGLMAGAAASVLASWSMVPFLVIGFRRVVARSPEALTGEISGVVDELGKLLPIYETAALFAIAGTILFLVASMSGGSRTSWTYRVGHAASITCAFAFLLGTVLSIVAWMHLMRHGNEFDRHPSARTEADDQSAGE